MTRNLVRDTNAMLRAYWDQIAAFADVLLCAPGHRLTARDVIAWHDEHFQRCSVTLSAQS
jgi:hypothetical protein